MKKIRWKMQQISVRKTTKSLRKTRFALDIKI